MIVRQVAHSRDDLPFTAGDQELAVLTVQIHLLETGQIGRNGDGVEQGKDRGTRTHDEIDGVRNLGGVHFSDSDVHEHGLIGRIAG